ncbi:hypothetical protein CK203_017669 [Vitis vinifera]|uniref:Uncharacterized protein n=1 Tax=Vitis vinifera TaxID=29760 RepID=A0A438JH04_VITVI|nr:hypothetical protein CK203_017669 [Vitis vinifera]
MEEKATEGMEKQAAKVRCQRMGCDVMFSPDDNPDDSCQYHDSLLIGWILLKPNVMSLKWSRTDSVF